MSKPRSSDHNSTNASFSARAGFNAAVADHCRMQGAYIRGTPKWKLSIRSAAKFSRKKKVTLPDCPFDWKEAAE